MNRKSTSPPVGYGYSLMSKEKINHLIGLLNNVENLFGSIAEVGVYRGGTAKSIVENTKSRVYLFDTFEGMPFYSEKDGEWDIGSFSETDINEILKLFNGKTNVEIHKGIFPTDTGYVIEKELFKFVHLDVDNYDSYKSCLGFFYSRMVKGGIISFDDYDHSCCPGANQAVDEFFQGKETLIKEKNVYIIKG